MEILKFKHYQIFLKKKINFVERKTTGKACFPPVMLLLKLASRGHV